MRFISLIVETARKTAVNANRIVEKNMYLQYIMLNEVYMSFPKDFVWGAATASYQVEGAVNEDGRQPSVWDEVSHWKGKVAQGDTGDVACDHYHRYKEDVDIMAALGLHNYRFSISWPRVLSYDSDYKGGAVKGRANEKGLDFYDRLIDALLEKGITPWMTMFHWDLPMELERKGGWRNRDIMYWARDYAQLLVKRYGDRVSHFFTINEMPCILAGYCGWMAPGIAVSQRERLNVIHNLLLTQGMMARAIRSIAGADTKIGFAHCGNAPYPLTDTADDIAAYKKAVTAITKDDGSLLEDSLTYWCDPIYLGRYPETAEAAFGADMPVVKDGDMDIISTPLDFHAQNIYQGRQITSPRGDDAIGKARGFSVKPFPQGYPITCARWPITPKSMNYFVRAIYERYKKPIYITENGMSGTDCVSKDGKCHDPLRIEFTRSYLTALNEAIEKGADVCGYFHWSLLDNFEWRQGYGERFGLVYVDYVTQKRTIKDSAFWYKEVIASNGERM